MAAWEAFGDVLSDQAQPLGVGVVGFGGSGVTRGSPCRPTDDLRDARGGDASGTSTEVARQVQSRGSIDQTSS
jgi:hypothetical protein